MDREKIYNEWSELKTKDGKLLTGKQTIDKCRKLSDENFNAFYMYIESIKDDPSIKSRSSAMQ